MDPGSAKLVGWHGGLFICSTVSLEFSVSVSGINLAALFFIMWWHRNA